MKKKIIIITGVFIFLLASGFVLVTSKKPERNKLVFDELLSRNSLLAQHEDWKMIQGRTASLKGKLQKDPADIKSMLSLISLYMNEGRITGNLSYYNNVALKLTETVLETEPSNFEALTFKSMILLSQHRFDEGLTVARQLQKINPYNAFLYGLLVDGYVETGNYKEALTAADKMISIRPDLRSYSRIAYLREIHGDIPGAIEAMKMAVESGLPGDENTEWCRVQIGKLYEQLGKIKEAQMHYTIATNNRAEYPYALAGLARIAVCEKDYKKSLMLFQKAFSILPDHTFKEGISELYTLMGEEEKAEQVANEIMEQMKIATGKTNGQNEDHEMAHAYLGLGDLDNALEWALKEYNRRPLNIEVNETVAIIYYQRREFSKALPYIEAALKTNCQNPEWLCYAGLIYAGAEEKKKASKYLEQALKTDPNISILLKKEVMKVWKGL